MINEHITSNIIASSFEVYNTLGQGFLEAVYQKAFAHEMELRSLRVILEQKVKVYYKDKEVGFYFCDIVVEDSILIEVKCVGRIILPHIKQVKNYLRATCYPIGYIFNFGENRVDFKKIFP